MKQRTYIAIDLKSFYASVECRERNLDLYTSWHSMSLNFRSAMVSQNSSSVRPAAL